MRTTIELLRRRAELLEEDVGEERLDREVREEAAAQAVEARQAIALLEALARLDRAGLAAAQKKAGLQHLKVERAVGLATCASCRWWTPSPYHERSFAREGECRRGPPLHDGKSMPSAHWPTTDRTAGCGEWQIEVPR